MFCLLRASASALVGFLVRRFSVKYVFSFNLTCLSAVRLVAAGRDGASLMWFLFFFNLVFLATDFLKFESCLLTDGAQIVWN